MGQCRTLDADVTIGCYYGDYSSCDNTIPTSLYIWTNFFFTHTCLPPFFNSTCSVVTAKLRMCVYYSHAHYFISILY